MPMSSPMITTMLGFCGCCAVAGALTAIEAATIASEPRILFKASIRHTPCQRLLSATADPRLDFVGIYFALVVSFEAIVPSRSPEYRRGGVSVKVVAL